MHRSSIALFLVLAGCGAAPLGPRVSATTVAASSEPPRPRLVVTVVYDQLASWVLEAHYARLDPAGAIRRTAERGRFEHRVAYAYGATYTAPGHAAIYTGAPPFESGVPSNRVWDRARDARLSSMDDATHPILGRDGAFASPARLVAESVADVLEAETGGAAITVSLGMKDRSAILPGGHHPDACFWFDARAGGFTTSTYYASALPDWLAGWQSAHPFADRMLPWVPEDPAALASLGPDDQPGEGSYGWGATFPHDAAGQEDPDAFLSIPGSTELLLELAGETVAQLHLGEDDVPDLLALSIASTDYVGHGYGSESWEYVDNLVRVDRALGRFLAALEQRGEIAVLLTADHGIAPLVERSRARGHTDAVRWTSEAELELLRAHLAATLGEGEWVEAWVQPYVYLPEAVRDGRERDRVVRAVIEHLATRPGISRTIDVRDADELRASGDPLDVQLGLGIAEEPPGELYVVPSEWSVAEEEMPADAGTSHGSPWTYDREVPVLFSGPGVAHGEGDEAGIGQDRVASTIARLLGVRAPEHGGAPLTGAP
jgi:predicted AlkP superfamily pyrophosphatase or phosphodiesterase